MFTRPIYFFVLFGVLLVGSLAGWFLREQFTVQKSEPLISQTEDKTYISSSQKLLNSSGTWAFYFVSKQQGAFEKMHAGLSDDPLSIMFNGETVYQTEGRTAYPGAEDKTFFIVPKLRNVKNGEERDLPAVGRLTGYGSVQIVGWLDENVLLAKECGGDGGGYICYYKSVGTYQDFPEDFGRYSFYDLTVDSDDLEFSDLVINEFKGLVFSQYCKPLENSCQDISVFSSQHPIKVVTIPTKNRMKEADFVKDPNNYLFTQQLRIDVGENGYFVLDIATVEVLESLGL